MQALPFFEKAVEAAEASRSNAAQPTIHRGVPASAAAPGPAPISDAPLGGLSPDLPRPVGRAGGFGRLRRARVSRPQEGGCPGEEALQRAQVPR
mgnify:CR=1 FL=1